MIHQEFKQIIPNLGWNSGDSQKTEIWDMLNSPNLMHALATHIYNPTYTDLEVIRREGFANPGTYTCLAVHDNRVISVIDHPYAILLTLTPMKLPYEANRFWAFLRKPMNNLSISDLAQLCPSGVTYHLHHGKDSSYGHVPSENIFLIETEVNKWVMSSTTAVQNFKRGMPERDVHRKLLISLSPVILKPLTSIHLPEATDLIMNTYACALTYSILLEHAINIIDLMNRKREQIKSHVNQLYSQTEASQELKDLIMNYRK